MFYNIYNITNIMFYVIFAICVLLFIYKIFLHISAFMPVKKYPEAKKNHKFAILIPARNESKVISGILDSIQKQNYDMSLVDTYVIVEKEDDPTCEIVKNYKNTHIIVRKNLNLKGKGYALDEAMQEILPKKLGYEAFFIFDADNILDTNYLNEMNKVVDQGYDVGLGYRNSKNWNDGWIAACSGLTFSMFSNFDNKPRFRLGLGIKVCGTGFFVAAKVIEDLGGWKFFTLTEDYEFSLYAITNNLKTAYNENAKFFDEQPISTKQSWNQRIRWCKGFTQANKIYTKKLIKSGIKDKGKARVDKLMYGFSIIPFAVTLASFVAYLVAHSVLTVVGLCIHDPNWYMPLICFGSAFLALYLFLVLYTICVIVADRKNSNLSFKNAFICCLMNPIFILLYIPIFVSSAFKKEVKWVAIEHGNSKNAKNTNN